MSYAAEPTREAAIAVARFWWLFLVTGVLWLIIGVILLQLNVESAATLGYLVGFMLIFTGIEQFFVASAVSGWKWVWILFGVFFVIGGFWAVFNPVGTTAALAASLGLLFVLIAIFWFIEAFATKAANSLWWLTLVAAIIMLGMGIWVSSQGFLEKTITLLVFAGIWALVHAVGDFVRAFQLKKAGNLVDA
jgi:uncharacterized membrane protein HdeD (DUF308 family)